MSIGYSVWLNRLWSIGLDLLAGLNEPQKEAVTQIEGPLLVLAGAGSGKTRVITRRVAYTIQQGIDPRSVLAITFTNKAAGEMRQRVIDLGTPHGATVCTFHSLCARLLREFSDKAGLSPNFTIYDRDDQVKLVKQIIAKLDMPVGNFSPSKVHSAISNAKNDLKTAQAYANQAGDFYSHHIAQVYHEYEKQLMDNHALDFDDLLLRMVFLLRDKPEVREFLGQRYKYVLIDEYQDTNHAQYILAHGIALDHHNICVTGDPDQSIYAWRGADINNILDFEGDYPNAKVVRLEENYRSTQPILTAASHLIEKNKMRKGKKLWTQKEGGLDVKVLLCDDEHAEANELARRVANYVREGGAYQDVAVFYRVNSLSRVIEEGLLTGGIPYRIARGVEFYNRKEVKDILAYLKLVVNPADDLCCRRIINTPARGIGAATINKLAVFGFSIAESILGACNRCEESGLGAGPVKKVQKFSELIASMSADLDRSVREIVEDVAQKSGLREFYGKSGEEGRDALANINELISTAAEFDEMSEGGTIGDYLHQISLVSDIDHLDGSGGAVSLMTLHAAKGLEFPVVYIVGCEDGLLPFQRGENNGAWQVGNSAEMEEERRLAFVGMTRAKENLTLSCARRRMVRGRTMPQAASCFLSEIGTETVSEEDLTTRNSERFSKSSKGGWSKGASFYEDVEQRAIIEAMADNPFPPEYEYLKNGCRISHPKFGPGKVVSIGTQPWPSTSIKIIFDDYGPKTIVLSMTTLEVL